MYGLKVAITLLEHVIILLNIYSRKIILILVKHSTLWM